MEVSKNLRSKVQSIHESKSSTRLWLSPKADGGQAKKSDIVKAWKAWFGCEVTGHSARRSGALHYVREGHALAQVKRLGRWKSDLVLECAKEALAAKPAFDSPLAKRDFMVDVAKLVDNLSREGKKLKHDPWLELEAVKDAVKAQSEVSNAEPLATNFTKVRALRIRSHRSGIVHDVDRNYEDETPHLWRTCCGWPFGHSNFLTCSLATLSMDARGAIPARLRQRGDRGGAIMIQASGGRCRTCAFSIQHENVRTFLVLHS